jgi:hypothetical protein
MFGLSFFLKSEGLLIPVNALFELIWESERIIIFLKQQTKVKGLIYSEKKQKKNLTKLFEKNNGDFP